jgi:hypothetical protein
LAPSSRKQTNEISTATHESCAENDIQRHIGIEAAGLAAPRPAQRSAMLETMPKLSADQCRAISEHLITHGDAARGNWFKELAEIAERDDWPSSVTAPFELLTEEESASIWNENPNTRGRVFAPYLTKTELAALRRRHKETVEYAERVFRKMPGLVPGVD